jgi:hypothetical protein
MQRRKPGRIVRVNVGAGLNKQQRGLFRKAGTGEQQRASPE